MGIFIFALPGIYPKEINRYVHKELVIRITHCDINKSEKLEISWISNIMRLVQLWAIYMMG